VRKGQANSTGVPPNKKVNKADELTYFSTNVALTNLTHAEFSFFIIFLHKLKAKLTMLGKIYLLG